MNAKLSIVVELLTPAMVASGADIGQLDPSQVSRITLVLTPEAAEGEKAAPRLETEFEHRRTHLIDLVEFARFTQPAGTPVELRFQGRTETLEI
jgi:hypothetical protein